MRDIDDNLLELRKIFIGKMILWLVCGFIITLMACSDRADLVLPTMFLAGILCVWVTLAKKMVNKEITRKQEVTDIKYIDKHYVFLLKVIPVLWVIFPNVALFVTSRTLNASILVLSGVLTVVVWSFLDSNCDYCFETTDAGR